jgi:predicted nuclease with RNAse H fold
MDIDLSMPVQREITPGRWVQYGTMGSTTRMRIENEAGTFSFQSVPKIYPYQGTTVPVANEDPGAGADRFNYRAYGSYDQRSAGTRNQAGLAGRIRRHRRHQCTQDPPQAMNAHLTVAGIDIGGERKGCHLVVLRGDEVVCNVNSREPRELLERCIEHGAVAVGVDSPCLWGVQGAGRRAERELAKERIFSFATPTRERALANTTGFYGWMFCGERIYQALAPGYPLLRGEAKGPVCFETFPHAITCAVLGRDVASAKQKKAQRRKLLEDAGIATAALKSIDAIDAALCALTARYYLQGQTRAYGDEESGYILVPAPRSQSPSCPAHAESA